MPADDLTIQPDFIFEEEKKYNTAISKFENGVEQRRSLWAIPLRTFKLSFKNRTQSEVGTINSLFDESLGSGDTFLWTNPNDSVQYTVRFESDSISIKKKAFGVYDFEFSLVQVK